jgi:choline dehydrogenase-like flavoprotein
VIIDVRTLPDGAVLDSDLCIIGGGAVGIAMALHFAGKRQSVCVLESGGLSLEKQNQALADGTLSGIPYFDLKETSFRLLGGNTFRWGARTSPLKEIDFARRNWVPRSGWPMTRQDLDPYYERVFEFIGLHRPFVYEGEVWQPFGVTPPAFDPALLQYCAFQFGKDVLLGERYRPQLAQASNVTVYLNATARNIRCSAEGSAVEGIDVATLAGQRHVARARRYVLACGGIENARLLLASDEQRRSGLCNEHDLVGRHFMEHPTVSAGTIVAKDWQRLHDYFSPGLVSGRLVEIGVALSPSVQEAERCLNIVARTNLVVTHDSTQALREIVWNLRYRRMPHQLKWYSDNKWLSQRLSAIARDPIGIVTNLALHAMNKPKRFKIDSMFLELRSEQAPTPDSRVTLSESRDALGQRRAHVHWALTALDKHTMRVAAQTFAAELARLDLGVVTIGDWLRTDDASFPAGLVGGHHHMGTTRMSADPTTGVVDANCKAHSLDNLYIAGSSVFPTSGYVNPTSTILALALRLAEHLEAQAASPCPMARTR